MQKNWKLELDSTITYLEGAVKGFTDPNKWDAFRNNNNTYMHGAARPPPSAIPA